MPHRLIKQSVAESYRSPTGHNPGQSFYQLKEYRERGDTGFKQSDTERIWSEVVGFGKNISKPAPVVDVSFAGLPVWERAKLKAQLEKIAHKLPPKRRQILLETGHSLLESKCYRCSERAWKHAVYAVGSLLCDQCYGKYLDEQEAVWRKNNPEYFRLWRKNHPGYHARRQSEYRKRKIIRRGLVSTASLDP